MKTIFTIALGGIISLALFSFNQKISRKTYKALRSGYTFVPSGKLELNGETKTLNSFIMSQGEVTNFHWLEFLYDLKASGETEKLAICTVDSAKWRTKLACNNAYQDFYHTHPAYRNYPVVNISKEAAELYCDWLTDHFLPNMESEKKLKFRLATHDEWIYAAKGGLTNGEYSWGGPYLTNSDGQQMANYVRFGAENIARDSTGKLTVVRFVKGNGIALGDEGDVTAPSPSYWPNGYGLFNMNGNVAEMVADENIVVGGSWKDPGYDVRNESTNPYLGAAPNVGFRVIATAQGEDVPWLKIKKK